MKRLRFNFQQEMDSLIQTDSLAPVQYMDLLKPQVPAAAEKRLMIAILEDAIECYQKYLHGDHRKGKTIFRETEDWIFSGDDVSPVSFNNVCDALGLDSSYVRAGLLRKRASLLAEYDAQAKPDASVPQRRRSKA